MFKEVATLTGGESASFNNTTSPSSCLPADGLWASVHPLASSLPPVTGAATSMAEQSQLSPFTPTECSSGEWQSPVGQAETEGLLRVEARLVGREWVTGPADALSSILRLTYRHMNIAVVGAWKRCQGWWR